MPAPNLFLIYVRDAEAATAFYSDLFEIEPTFTSPHYVALGLATPRRPVRVVDGGQRTRGPEHPSHERSRADGAGEQRPQLTRSSRVGSRRESMSWRSRTTLSSAARS